MIYMKLIRGWVAQHYDNETGACIQQEFIADEGEAVVREFADGQPIPEDQITELANTEKECAADMVQP